MTEPRLTQTLGGPSLAVTLAGQVVPTDQVGPVTIRHGRDDPTQPVDAASCQVSFAEAALTALPTIGAPLVIELGAGAIAYAGLSGAQLTAARTRFTGHVTDVVAMPARQGTPARVSVVAVSRRGRLGRTIVGDTPWPVETDGARASRILALAAPIVGATVGAIDTGTVQVTARDVDAQPALDLLNTLALDSGGQLVELRDGTLTWHDAEHRRNSAVDVELTADDVLANLTATQRLAGIVNRLTVSYGPPVAGAERPSVTSEDAVSRTDHGPFSATLASQLQLLADAEAFARLTVGRRSRPRWELRQLQVDLTRTVTPTVARQLLLLEHADLVNVVGFPTTGPFSTARLWVEGWTETITRDAWGMQLAVSDYGRNSPPPRWVDIPTSVTWANVDPALTWTQAAGWDPGQVDLGRWADEPSDRRWLDVTPADLTWANA